MRYSQRWSESKQQKKISENARITATVLVRAAITEKEGVYIMQTIFYEQTKDIDKQIAAVFDAAKTEKHGIKSYWMIGSGFDCETTKTAKGFSYVYLWQFSLADLVIMGRTTTSAESFFMLLNDIALKAYRRKHHNKPKQYPQLLIWDCNLGYEWAHFKRNFARLNIRSVFAKDRRHPLSINVSESLEFREALGVFGYSLANIAQTYTRTQKMVGDLDYSIQRNSFTELDETELQYCINDVVILSELGYIAFDMFKGSIPMTGTGIIRKAVKDKIRSHGKLSLEFAKNRVRKLMPKTLKDYQIMSQLLFCGGWAHSYFPAVGKVYQNVICADLTSDFPAQMCHHNFPAGCLIGNRTFEEMCEFKHWYAMITFHGIRTKYKHSLISEHKLIDKRNLTVDNGRVFSADLISVYCTEIDFGNIMMIYDFDAVEFSDIHVFTRSEPCTKELIDVMMQQYRRKNELKQQGKSGTREYAESKKFVNGCYGMTATKIYTSDVVYNEKINDFDNKQSEKTYDELIADLWLSPWIAIYTTAYARSVLVGFIKKYPDIIIQYDTDSLYFLDGLPESEALKADMQAYNEMITKKNQQIFNGDPFFYSLGTWDFDEPIDKFKCLGAKRYIKQTGSKIKAVCAGCKPEFYNKYCEENGLDHFDFFDNGMNLPTHKSGKTTLCYFDNGVYEDYITDPAGHTQHVKIETCAVIRDIPFGIFMSKMWLWFMKQYKEDQRYLGHSPDDERR